MSGMIDGYEGDVGKEKKTHQTHFTVVGSRKLKGSGKTYYDWIEVGPGRYVLKKREVVDAGKASEVK